MSNQEIIDGLIASYRELNFTVRGFTPSLSDDTPSIDDPSIRDILAQMYNRELHASRAFRVMVAGEDSPADDDAPDQETSRISQAVNVPLQYLISQFGTAREATLAMLRGQPEEVWNRETMTPRGRMSLRDYAWTLVERDRRQLQRIGELLEAEDQPCPVEQSSTPKRGALTLVS